MFIKNTWYVAAWDHEVETEGLFARTIIGVPILMFRTSDGKLIDIADPQFGYAHQYERTVLFFFTWRSSDLPEEKPTRSICSEG